MKRILSALVGLLFFAAIAPAADGKKVTIRWHGQSFFEIISSAGTRIVIDPHAIEAYGRNPVVADVVLATHAHTDHTRFEVIENGATTQLQHGTAGLAMPAKIERGKTISMTPASGFQGRTAVESAVEPPPGRLPGEREAITMRVVYPCATARLYAETVRSTIASHLNWLAWMRPAAPNAVRSAESFNSRVTCSAISRGFAGSTMIAALPATSGRDETFDVTTGAPQAIASRTGRPKPS